MMNFHAFKASKSLILALFVVLSVNTLLIAQTVTNAGNWDNSAIWASGNIGDAIGENVSFNNNLGGTGIVTVRSGFNYTIGNLNMNAGNDLVVAQGGTLNIGNAGNSRNLTPGNNNSITVSGTLVVWGNLSPGGNFILNVTSTGVLIVKGNLPMGNDTDFTADGSVDIDGSFSMGGNADLIIRGPFDVGTTFTLNNDADLAIHSPADVNIGGNFSMGGNADFTIDSGADMDIGGNFTVQNDADVIVNGGLSIGGDFSGGGNLDITVGTNGDLDIGDDITFNNDANIIVNGDMDVVGDFTGGGNADIVVNNGGDLNVGEDVLLTGNDGNIDVNSGGSFDIVGDFTGGSNTDFDVDGRVTIGDDLSVGNNSNANGSGQILVGGDCTDGTSNFCGQGPMGLLPIKLVYFRATLTDGNEVSLTWATEEEKDFDHFELERASGNLKFLPLSTVSGSGYNTQSLREYSWVDSNPYAGENYYRLKAVDLDGSFEYFKVATVSAPGNRRFSVYPNPTQENFVNYALNFEYSGNDRIIVMDNMGNVLQQISVSAIEGKVTFGESIKPGLYFVQYVSDNFRQIVRVTVR